MKLKRIERGFTIIELLIATMVFSVVLLLCATGLIKIGRAYTKGVISARTQETARNVIESVSQTIQLNPGTFTGPVGPGPSNETYAYCIGNRQFSYLLHKKLSTTSGVDDTRHVLISHATASGGCPAGSPTDPVVSIDSDTALGQELLAQRMQLARLDILNLGSGRFRISVKVIYGDDDLFQDPNTSDASCKPQLGVEYCAVSELSTIIQRRVK